ncbi:DUF4238 domain-containing protein [Sporosalibacterium faouarense]|uniref:DUF4238 domain-containing protein n=1 Tax=Sporosalibacterium faouarense TaxID=516123 RepID=UPI00192AC958|nr:DUF4238 domain-containing protein [Sporosalibacterium faouarense]
MEYRYQHFVPRTYLEAWQNDNEKLRIRNAKTGKVFYRPPKEFMGKNEYYTITADDFLIHTEEDLEAIFGELKEYKIIIGGEEITDLKLFSDNYRTIDDWEIYNLDGSEADKEIIKGSLKKKRVLDIEFGFHAIEGDWNIIRDEIQKTVDSKGYKLNIEVADRLVDFIVTQKERTEGRKREYQEILDVMMGDLKGTFGEENYNTIFKEYLNAYFRKTIRRYQNGEEEHHAKKSKDLLRQLHTVIYKATGNRTFITSDNPVFRITDNSFYKGKYNGIYMPITPNIMVALYKGDNMSYTIGQMPVNLIKRINRKIKEGATRFYVEKDK